MCKLSIIIPVYNSENFIINCINSLLCDIDFDYEILLIDDGSTDNSLSILKEYESKNNKIKVYSKKNEGVSETRNFGINKCNGKYITFIDSDDLVDEKYLYKIKEVIEYNYDLVVFGYKILFIDEKYEIINECIDRNYNLFDKEKCLNDLFKYNLFNFPWNKIYKKEKISNIKFLDKYYQGEDLAFNCEYFKNCNSISLISDNLYIYLKRNSETMSNKFVKDYDVILNNKKKLLLDLFENYDKQVLYDYMLKEYEVFVINLYKSNLYSFKDRNKLIKDNVLSNIENIKISNPTTTYSKIFKIIVLSNNCSVINIFYMILYLFKNIFSSIYLKIRKKVYITDAN